MANGEFKIENRGHSISLRRLKMEGTYDGLLEGKPERISNNLRENPRQVLKNFVRDDIKFAFLDTKEPILPSFIWVGLFHSPKGVKTSDCDFESELCICWFSDYIPTSISKMILEVLKRINWLEQAEDFDFTLM